MRTFQNAASNVHVNADPGAGAVGDQRVGNEKERQNLAPGVVIVPANTRIAGAAAASLAAPAKPPNADVDATLKSWLRFANE